MITVNDILNFTETFAPLNTQMEFDNSGLLVGDGDTKVTKALVTLDITNEVVDEAVSLGAELVISHHPVIFSPLKRVQREDAVYKLINNGIDALCLHTNLDLSPEFGVNTCLADAIGVENYMFADGECLLIGELKEETTAKDFAHTVKTALNCNGVRFTNGNKKIKTVAICSGSGGDLAPLAKEYNADVLVTGEIKHNQILTANKLDIAVIDGSHYRTEDIVIEPLCKKLAEKFPDVQFIKSTAFSDDLQFI